MRDIANGQVYVQLKQKKRYAPATRFDGSYTVRLHKSDAMEYLGLTHYPTKSLIKRHYSDPESFGRACVELCNFWSKKWDERNV